MGMPGRKLGRAGAIWPVEMAGQITAGRQWNKTG